MYLLVLFVNYGLSISLNEYTDFIDRYRVNLN